MNILFYGFFSFALLVIHTLHLWVAHPGGGVGPAFFMSHVVVQSLLEGLFLAYLSEHFRKVRYLFATVTMILLSCHFIDFFLVRLVNFSLPQSIDLVMDESVANVIELMLLTGLGWPYWALIFGSIFLGVPALSVMIYKLTDRVKVPISRHVMRNGIFILPFAMLALDLTVAPTVSPQELERFEQVLPFKSTLLMKRPEMVHMEHPLKRLGRQAPLPRVDVTEKPNIYLFVVESIRQDYMIPEYAPNITAFREENISVEKTYSNANATQISWFSLFHSEFPIHWAERHGPSLPIQALKEMGYKINVLSSAPLGYYEMQKRIFGESGELLDFVEEYPHYPPEEACDSDVQVMARLEEEVGQKKTGNVFICFLDATHFDYSWPEDYPTHFEPVQKGSSHIRLSHSPEVMEFITNRYKNSIHFADSLVGDFFKTLKEKKLYDESVIVVLGDHGEEFYEEGHLYHASQLSEMQITPPIYMKLGDNERYNQLVFKHQIMSHMDVLPTICDYLVPEHPVVGRVEGQSLFREREWPFIMTSRFNGSRPPREFMIVGVDKKARFRMTERRDIFSGRTCQVFNTQLDTTDLESVYKKLFGK